MMVQWFAHDNSGEQMPDAETSALTKAEWMRIHADPQLWSATIADLANELGEELGRDPSSRNRAAGAAMLLDGQPFGFTWEDVDELLSCASMDEDEYRGPERGFVSPLRAIADRIAALLPPRQGS